MRYSELLEKCDCMTPEQHKEGLPHMEDCQFRVFLDTNNRRGEVKFVPCGMPECEPMALATVDDIPGFCGCWEGSRYGEFSGSIVRMTASRFSVTSRGAEFQHEFPTLDEAAKFLAVVTCEAHS